MASSIFNPGGSGGSGYLAPDGSVTAPSYGFASLAAQGLGGGMCLNSSAFGPYLVSNNQPFLCSDQNRAQRAMFDGQFGIGFATGSPMTTNPVADTIVARTAPGTISLTGTTPMIQFGGTTGSFPALKQSGAGLMVKYADDSGYSTITANFNCGGVIQFSSNTLLSALAPSIASGFGTSPSIPSFNGSAAFVVNVGTGGAATSGVITMPAAGTGWIVLCNDIGNTAGLHTFQTAGTTTSITLQCQNSAGTPTAWASGTLVRVIAMGY